MPPASVPKVATVIGNRPQFVKAAAVSLPLRALAKEILIHSGQHYDAELSDVFFEELALPAPDRNLGVGSGSHARQTAATMAALEPVLTELRPAAVVVYGDTNTTLAASLTAAKLGIPVAHVEAGARSFNRAMPEEVNRVAVDRLSDLLLCPTAACVENLENEGLGERAVQAGDVMADVAGRFGPLAERGSDVIAGLGLEHGAYLLATLHRAGNVDDPTALAAAIQLLRDAAGRHGPLVLPLHPRTRAALAGSGLLARLEEDPEVIATEPLGYLDFAALMRGASVVLTDSGGLQKEAYLAGVPCLTMREETEWVETVESGWNELAGLDRAVAAEGLERLIGLDRSTPPDPTVYGDGRSGERCAQEIVTLAAG
jgi:UDP-N-acetylglucosamine 2-epimerase (non-hydrolysing)/UDP-GlcNAc3NAcA epimerase